MELRTPLRLTKEENVRLRQSLYAAVNVALWLYRLLEQADFWLSVKKKTKSLAQV